MGLGTREMNCWTELFWLSTMGAAGIVVMIIESWWLFEIYVIYGKIFLSNRPFSIHVGWMTYNVSWSTIVVGNDNEFGLVHVEWNQYLCCLGLEYLMAKLPRKFFFLGIWVCKYPGISKISVWECIPNHPVSLSTSDPIPPPPSTIAWGVDLLYPMTWISGLKWNHPVTKCSLKDFHSTLFSRKLIVESNSSNVIRC